MALTAVSGGLRLNRTTGITEYLETPTGTQLLVTGSGNTQGTISIWFSLAEVGGRRQCIWTSLGESGRVAFLEVTADGDLWLYFTRRSDGVAWNQLIATGLQPNTLYHYVYANGGATAQAQYWQGAAVPIPQFGIAPFQHNLILGARRFANGSTPPAIDQPMTWSVGNGYWNHATVTIYEVLTSNQAVTANQVRGLYNSGRGIMPECRTFSGVTWRNLYKFSATRWNGTNAITPILGTTPITLTQTGGSQSNQYGQRYGNALP